jgi:hypothetical protein
MRQIIDGLKRDRRSGKRGESRKKYYALYRSYRFSHTLGLGTITYHKFIQTLYENFPVH